MTATGEAVFASEAKQSRLRCGIRIASSLTLLAMTGPAARLVLP